MTLLHSHASKSTVAFFTSYIFAIWTLKYFLDPFEQLSAIPHDYASLVGIIRWIPDILVRSAMNTTTLFFLRIVIIGCCLSCMFRKAPAIVSVLSCVLIVVEQSLLRGFGHVNHAEVALILTTIVLVAYSVADSTRLVQSQLVDNTYNPNAAPLITIVFLFCLTYSLVGIERLTTGGYTIFTSDMMLNVTLHHSHLSGLVDFGLGQRIDEMPYLLAAIKVGFPIITVIEILAPLCLISHRFRYCFIFVMIAFHLSNMILMHILFIENILLMLFLFDVSLSKHSGVHCDSRLSVPKSRT